MAIGELSAKTGPFDYGAAAELFSTCGQRSGRQSCGYWRFDHAAEAIRFAIEKLSPKLLAGAYLEVNEARFDNRRIRSLYDHAEYPLARRSRAQLG
jgi:hypothetical protein